MVLVQSQSSEVRSPNRTAMYQYPNRALTQLANHLSGMSGTYFSFAAIGTLAVLTIFLVVPETKGKTLEQIEVTWRVESWPNG